MTDEVERLPDGFPLGTIQEAGSCRIESTPETICAYDGDELIAKMPNTTTRYRVAVRSVMAQRLMQNMRAAKEQPEQGPGAPE